MAAIYDSQAVAQHLKEGIRAFAQHRGKSIEETDGDIACWLDKSESTVKSWKSPDNIPTNVGIDTGALLGIAWLVLSSECLGLSWLTGLLRGTDIPLYEPPSHELVKACLEKAVFRNPPDPTQILALSDTNIESIVERLFEENHRQSPSEKPKRGSLPSGSIQKRHRLIFAALAAALIVSAPALWKLSTLPRSKEKSPAASQAAPTPLNPRIICSLPEWCSAIPSRAEAASSGAGSPYYVSFDPAVKLDEFYIYFDNSYLGPDILTFEGPDFEHNDEWKFGISKSWIDAHPNWSQKTLWRLDFRSQP